ncbi:MAG: tetratricopeptide repeat protein [Saprospiraceae bacterium]|nr:tetratricopeptide repeat protein [Saprospiraceae bacterium]
MKSLKTAGYFLFFLFIAQVVTAQVLDEETGFIYVKAEYLFETGRYDEAIAQYNTVISKDPKYKDALVHRGMSKYAMAAYKGAKMDAIQYIDLKGINGSSAALLGRSFAAMNDKNAAINSLTAAIALEDKNAQYYEWRADIYENNDMLLKACQDYEMAMNLGSQAAAIKAKNLCGISKTKTKPNQVPDTDVTSGGSNPPQGNTSPASQPSNPNELGEDEVLSSGTKEEETPPAGSASGQVVAKDSTIIDDSEPVVDENLPKNDDTVNSFVIDEDLSIDVYGQELGKEKSTRYQAFLYSQMKTGKLLSISVSIKRVK